MALRSIRGCTGKRGPIRTEEIRAGGYDGPVDRSELYGGMLWDVVLHRDAPSRAALGLPELEAPSTPQIGAPE